MLSVGPMSRVAVLLLLVADGAAGRDVFGDAWSEATDPLAIGRGSATLSESAQRSIIQLSQLESQTNLDAKARLEQIREIIEAAKNGGKDVLDQAEKAMLNLEKEINQDANDKIYRLSCLAGKIANETLQQAILTALGNVEKAKPELKILGVNVATFESEKVDLPNPNDAYWATKKVVLDDLDRRLKDEQTGAWIVPDTYQNLERLARATQCFYLDQLGAADFVEEANEFERLSRPWRYVVRPQHF